MQQVSAFEFLSQNEADIVQYFGKIRNGKTYIATSDILNLLSRGHVVYANWKIKWEGYDQRKVLPYKILGLLGFKKRFLYFPPENFRYLPIDDKFFEKFGRLTDCDVFLDEGHLVFNSYEMANMNLFKQASILHTGHFNRSIRIISQRPNNVHVQMRANVNYFFECRKVLSFMGFNVFKKILYEDMVNGDTVDLDQPVKHWFYFGNKRVYGAYDTKYLRGNLPASQANLTQAWYISWVEQVRSLRLKAAPPLPRGRSARGEAEKAALPPSASGT